MWELRSLFLVIGLLYIITLRVRLRCVVLVELLGPPTAS